MCVQTEMMIGLVNHYDESILVSPSHDICCGLGMTRREREFDELVLSNHLLLLWSRCLLVCEVKMTIKMGPATIGFWKLQCCTAVER